MTPRIRLGPGIFPLLVLGSVAWGATRAAPSGVTTTVQRSGASRLAAPRVPEDTTLFDVPLDTLVSGRTECYGYPRYFVAARPLEEEVGSDVLVRRLAAGARGAPAAGCAFDSIAGDYVVRNHWAEYFEGLRGDLLFLYSGTGPQGSVVVHDIAGRRELIEIETDQLVSWRDSVTLVLWLRRDTVPHSRCPEVPEGLLAGMDSLMALDLGTLHLTALGPARCEAWQ
jgi:hypothetical protein